MQDEKNIIAAICKYVDSQMALKPMVFHNVETDTPGPINVNHFELFIMFAKPSNFTLSGSSKLQGIVQVNVKTKAGAGDIEATTLAGYVQIAFARFTTLTEGSNTVRFDERGTIAESMVKGDWAVTPCSFSFHSFVK